MAITYAWTCNFCGVGNAAGTDRCAVCRNKAIARPIDFDLRFKNERLEEQRRKEQMEALPPRVRFVVGFLWGVAAVGAGVAKFAWTIGATVVGLVIAGVAGIPAVILTKMYEAPPSSKVGNDA
jgi:hypothetical protein